MDPKTRSTARECTVKALYQWQLTAHSPEQLCADRFDDPNAQPSKPIDVSYFEECLHGVLNHQQEIDAVIDSVSSRPVKLLDGVERAVLRLAVYELKHRLDIPYKVIIDEALELTKRFGSVEGFKFVNGVLDKIARSREDFKSE